jgi:hypothetical protein
MWYELCVNPQALRALYDSAEGLDRVRLFAVALRQDGRLELRVELPRFPDHPPERWHPEANRVQVALDAWSVQDVRIQGWAPESAGLLTLSRAGDALDLAFQSEGVRITLRCGMARIAGFSPYTAGEPDADA